MHVLRTRAGVGSIICDDNGTGANPSDDTFTFTLNPTGSNLGSGYSVSGDVTACCNSYGSATTFGPFPISGGNLNITITDNDDASCTITNLTITVPATCSNACNLPGAGVGSIIM